MTVGVSSAVLRLTPTVLTQRRVATGGGVLRFSLCASSIDHLMVRRGDAEAIREAVRRPTIRFLRIKSAKIGARDRAHRAHQRVAQTGRHCAQSRSA